MRNEDLDKVLNKLIASTRSPRGRFSAEESWKLLQSKLTARRSRRRFWLRAASSAAVVLLCVASWATYRALQPVTAHPEPTPKESLVTTQPPRPDTLFFSQQPLQEIIRQLSDVYRVKIRVDDDSLRNYRMTGTFSTDEDLTQILDLLKNAAGNFTYTQDNKTIIITKLNRL